MSELTDRLFSLNDKVAVVTGGTGGIGLMAARGLAGAGARVCISARSQERCDSIAADLSAITPGCVGIAGNLATSEGADALAQAIAARESRIDILVNNAGATWGEPLETYPDTAFDRVLDLNVKAVFRLTQQLLPLLRAAGTAEDPARVVNIGSVDGIRVPLMETYAYSASKAAVHMLTRHLASRLRSEHVTVNAIAPGPFDSKMMAFALNQADSRQAVASRVPMGRIGEADDIAGAMLFLTSRAGAYTTGAVIPVDGGISTIVTS